MRYMNTIEMYISCFFINLLIKQFQQALSDDVVARSRPLEEPEGESTIAIHLNQKENFL